ncbi:MAG: response regulator [Betaproteobacteria bacterium]|nr:response regulator [Betaproteobacteria bacterium]
MTNLKVLVVDDNQTNRLLPGLFLRALGHEVSECDSAEQALAWLADNPCDLLLLDITMPLVSGLELCHQLRAQEQLKHLRIIAYTAHALPHEVALLKGAGFDQVLLKPISSQDLREAIGS